MKKIVFLTGAGVSAESVISTFRDSGGLWEKHDVTEVASAMGWENNPALVLEFYNQRRAKLEGVETNATHLHGELTKVRPEDSYTLADGFDESRVKDIGFSAIKPGDVDERGVQYRPHIVFFWQFTPVDCPVYVIDPKDTPIDDEDDVIHIKENATTGVAKVIEMIRNQSNV